MKTQQELEEYWNNKHPKNPIIYTGRISPAKCQCCQQTAVSKRLNIDVKTMLSTHDAICENIVSKFNLKQATHDATMLMIQKHVVKNLKYIGDDISKCSVEYWQFPFETIEFKNGDCEDGALLIAALAIHAGVPAFRVRVTAGMVQQGPTAPQGGHAYVSYLRESDNQWVAIDWCYLEDSQISMERKTLLSKNPYYKEVWFSFNHLYSWSNKAFEFCTF